MRSRYIALAALGAILAWPGAAPADPVRTLLQHSDLPPAPPQTATLGKVLLKAGDPPAWHSHAGIELGYVLTGQMILSIAGAPDQIVVPGQSFLVPRGTPHSTRALGASDATIASTWVTDTGAPLATPAAPPKQP
jgi:quercetin dioxygenase-like cupin family protein